MPKEVRDQDGNPATTERGVLITCERKGGRGSRSCVLMLSAGRPMGSFTLLTVLGSGSCRRARALLGHAVSLELLKILFGQAVLSSPPAFGCISGAYREYSKDLGPRL